jgi:hypothetical protein
MAVTVARAPVLRVSLAASLISQSKRGVLFR